MFTDKLILRNSNSKNVVVRVDNLNSGETTSNCSRHDNNYKDDDGEDNINVAIKYNLSIDNGRHAVIKYNDDNNNNNYRMMCHRRSINQTTNRRFRGFTNKLQLKRHIILFITLVLCCIIRGNWAGFACLSNPCVFGVCIDDLNR